jgi:hypothetical protein
MQQQARVVIEPRGEGLGRASFPATKAYADECWTKCPKISPDSWRVWEGLTLGKVAPLISVGTTEADLDFFYTHGMNGWLVTPGGIPAVQDWTRARGADVRSRIVLIGLWPWGVEMPFSPSDLILWDAVMLVWPERPLDTDALTGAFVRLEKAVREGDIQAYGFAAEGWVTEKGAPAFFSVGEVLTLAQEAAHQAWGRRKRPALRLAGISLNLLELGALQYGNTVLENPEGGEDVPTLETLARAGIGTVALRCLRASHQGQEVFFNTGMGQSELGQSLVTSLLARLPTEWAQLTLPQAALQIVANIPGVTAVALEPTAGVSASEIPEIFHHGGHPDIATVIGWVK